MLHYGKIEKLERNVLNYIEVGLYSIVQSIELELNMIEFLLKEIDCGSICADSLPFP